MKDDMFTALPDNAKAEDIARRIGEMIAVIDGGKEMVLARFTAGLTKEWPDRHDNPLAAELKLRDTLEAARDKRTLSQFTRRFLSKQYVKALVSEMHPLYVQASLAQNGGSVADAVRKGAGKATPAPETAVFKSRKVQS